ncbi:MAG TPA: alpha/beta fold hydrolase [Ramlibacter sp.]|uniref:alpha/beta fold hydrolase n=1 Tax=Ramlibacter sp. TaxID=1917967 RepID=UPI002D7EEF60|nr:alpha/beta fold hydrolase [Ramlibacter sp.]HET8746538.1 alpha/beta fold hydrolase [Ramlibacter sp.]
MSKAAAIVHRLPLDGGHVMHVGEYGNPAGRPALVLHGGPGSGSSPLQRAGLDPARWRILCPDQRGAGLSTPRGEIAHNTLAHLLADLRLLRAQLQVPNWLVVGGSWGATLALLHAIDQPEAVTGLVLRNPFLAREEDIARFFAAAIDTGVPGWADLTQQAASAQQSLPALLADLFAHGPMEAQRAAAACWWDSEQRLAGAAPTATPIEDELQRLVDRYRIQSHYLKDGCWLAPTPLLQRCERLPPVPVEIVQGMQDRICPPEGARALAQAIGARANLRLVEGAGHDPSQPAMLEAVRQAVQACGAAGLQR